MVPAILSIEIFSFVLVAILLYASLFEARQKTKKKNIFIALLSCSLVSIAADALSWILEGKAQFPFLYAALLLIAFVSVDVMLAIFTQYIGTHISYKTGSFPFAYRILAIACAAFSVVTFIGCFAGWWYHIENCSYEPTETYVIYSVFQFVILILSFLFALPYVRKIGVHDMIVIAIYSFLPILIGISNIGGIGYELTYAALGISVLIIYITLQSEHEVGLIRENKISYQQARVDGLTGLNNRLAYYEFMIRIDPSASLAVFFCDLNGLKEANDTQGHEVGDQLLRNCSETLRSFFKKDEIFRIGGDEFIVLIPGIKESVFDERVAKLTESVAKEEKPLFSMGYAFGDGAHSHKVVRLAEEMMYRDKEAFHARFPSEKRR